MAHYISSFNSFNLSSIRRSLQLKTTNWIWDKSHRMKMRTISMNKEVKNGATQQRMGAAIKFAVAIQADLFG